MKKLLLDTLSIAVILIGLFLIIWTDLKSSDVLVKTKQNTVKATELIKTLNLQVRKRKINW